jgi:dephospho-CoA kinase
MKRLEFDKLSPEEQVKEFNKMYEIHKSIRKVCGEIGIGKSTVKDRFNKIGYYSIEGVGYVKGTNAQLEGQTSLVKPVRENKGILNINELSEKNKSKTNITELEQIVNRLIDKRLEDLKKIEKTGEIELNFEGKTMYRSFGINEDVLNRFNEYAKKHNRFNKVELLSLALNELMDKYK